MQSLGWSLMVHPLFHDQLEQLTAGVERLASQQPHRWQSHPAAKLLATIRRYILEIIPRDPNAPQFRLGNALGADNRHWFRAKFHRRFRLFFRFSSRYKMIVYVWVNEESSLRKAGSRSDPYTRFREMLESGVVPDSLDELLRISQSLQ